MSSWGPRCAIALVALAAATAGCGGSDRGEDKASDPGGAGEARPAVRPADVKTCLEAGTEVSEDQSEVAFDDPTFYKLAIRQLGYLDVDFADVYFFRDGAEREHEVAKTKKTLRDAKVGDYFDGDEAFGNVVVDYGGSEDTDDKGLIASCLAKAGPREDLGTGA